LIDAPTRTRHETRRLAAVAAIAAAGGTAAGRADARGACGRSVVCLASAGRGGVAPERGSVGKLLKLARASRVPVTARGAGYGYVGGCVPVCGGMVVSLARMNRIKEISGRDFAAVVEPVSSRRTCRNGVSGGALLSARSGQPLRLLDRGEYCDQRGRSALSEVWGDAGLCAWGGSGVGGWHGRSAGRSHPQEQDRVRPGAAVCRFGGAVGSCDGGDA
jgi:hypothetical protein